MGEGRNKWVANFTQGERRTSKDAQERFELLNLFVEKEDRKLLCIKCQEMERKELCACSFGGESAFS